MGIIQVILPLLRPTIWVLGRIDPKIGKIRVIKTTLISEQAIRTTLISKIGIMYKTSPIDFLRDVGHTASLGQEQKIPL